MLGLWKVGFTRTSAMRNRLGQITVDWLVRAHTHKLVALESKLEEWESTVLPWELDMVAEDPAGDDEC
eukprot:scaffold152426_cov27-Tisochrysis_lutea.AAC.1